MPAIAKKITRTPRRWESGGLYIVNNSVVGTVTEDAFDRGFWAHGCLSEWQDADLGLQKTESIARHKVEQWVKDND